MIPVHQRSFALRSAIVAVIAALLAPAVVHGQPGKRNRVELEIVSDASGGIDQNQRWLEVLAEVGADGVRLMQSSRGSKPGVQKIEGASGSTFKITGVIANNRLVLPAGRFDMRDTARITEYVAGIRADGAEVALAEKLAFGLTAKQLVDLHGELSRPLADSSVGRTPLEILQSVEQVVAMPVVVGPAAAAALRSDYTLVDELQGLAHGTALAAALRPLGLVLAPQREQGGAVEIHIVDSRSAEEFWPVGWPLQRAINEAAPKLFERIPVNISNYTLAATLPAIQKKVETPFLFDHNSLAMAGVNMELIRLNLESDNLSYMVTLRRLISQARPRMDFEVRADEAGKPFVWFFALP